MPLDRAVVALSHEPAVLALRALGLGDLLTAVPALRGLASAYPAHRCILAAPAQLAPLAGLIGWEVAPAGELEPLPESLYGADVAANLHGRGPQSHRLLAAARPARAIWFEHREVPESAGSPAWLAGEHEVGRWCRLLIESGIPADTGDLRLDPPPGAPPPGTPGATLIHPGAASAARRWPAENFAAVARAEAGAGRRVVVTGSRAELPLALEVAGRAGLSSRVVLAGETDLTDLARAVAAAGRVVCGDTGIAHLATAFRTPSVLVFGPTSPAEWGPPPDAGRHRVLWAGRTGDPHDERPDPGLLEIGVDDALEALGGLGPR
jgi:ADP-heptose:LPS heptosyltransferase